MQYAITESGERLSVVKDRPGFCPGCRARLIPKALKSPFVTPHWCHKAGDCDPWYESETEWHLSWKARFPEACREVTIPPHRADLKLRTGLVVELQHSPLSHEKISERERFYGEMVWLLDLPDRRAEFCVWQGSIPHLAGVWRHVRSLRGGEYVSMSRRTAKKSWSVSGKPILIDIGDNLLLQADFVNGSSRSLELVYGHVWRVDTQQDTEAFATSFDAAIRHFGEAQFRISQCLQEAERARQSELLREVNARRARLALLQQEIYREIRREEAEAETGHVSLFYREQERLEVSRRKEAENAAEAESTHVLLFYQEQEKEARANRERLVEEERQERLRRDTERAYARAIARRESGAWVRQKYEKLEKLARTQGRLEDATRYAVQVAKWSS